MKPLLEQLTELASNAFEAIDLNPSFGIVHVTNRPDLGQFQCNGAMAAAKQEKKDPRIIAQQIIDRLSLNKGIFNALSIEGPGFINMTLSDDFLLEYINRMASDKRMGCDRVIKPCKIVIDYGGANIAKPLHVGHLRSAIIGESLKRISRFLGHEVISDVHLGDWGLQIGMIISELARRQPSLPYFNPDYKGDYPGQSPVTIEELEEIYPLASSRAKNDISRMEEARLATNELQKGREGYVALWKHIRNISIADLKDNYTILGIHFDLWLGESDTQARIPSLITKLISNGLAYESEGALIIDIAEPDDKKELPPMILAKSDGSALYGTTDLATIEQRVEDYNPDLILYVVDERQSDHFRQVFRCAYKTGIVSSSLKFEHIGFGTMNGMDGKPFKTREGGVMKLKDLIQMITDKALEVMNSSDIAESYDAFERKNIARIVGVATLKYADLMNHRMKNYVFDLDRFASFEGQTGPYLLYTSVRIKSILRKAHEQGLYPGTIVLPVSNMERDILLKIAELSDILKSVFNNRAPNYLCEYAYNIASLFNYFYHECHILSEKNKILQTSWLGLSRLTKDILDLVLDLLGLPVPERM